MIDLLNFSDMWRCCADIATPLCLLGDRGRSEALCAAAHQWGLMDRAHNKKSPGTQGQ